MTPEAAPYSNELADLAFFCIDHAIASLPQGGPLTPFVVVERLGKRQLYRFAFDRLEAGVSAARKHAATELTTAASELDRVAITYDGLVTLQGEKQDAILVEAYDSAPPNGHVLAQRYGQAGDHTQAIGNAMYLGAAPKLT